MKGLALRVLVQNLGFVAASFTFYGQESKDFRIFGCKSLSLGLSVRSDKRLMKRFMI